MLAGQFSQTNTTTVSNMLLPILTVLSFEDGIASALALCDTNQLLFFSRNYIHRSPCLRVAFAAAL
jgi:hypothetical protein